MATYAQIVERSAFLFTEFGENLANKYFSQSKIESLGRYVRGNHKGQLKGKITWKKVEKGGWVKVDGLCEGGYVETRIGKVIEIALQTSPWNSEPETIDYIYID